MISANASVLWTRSPDCGQTTIQSGCRSAARRSMSCAADAAAYSRTRSSFVLRVITTVCPRVPAQWRKSRLADPFRHVGGERLTLSLIDVHRLALDDRLLEGGGIHE